MKKLMVFFIVLLIGVSVDAQPGPRGQRNENMEVRDQPGKRMADYLNLSEAQQAQMKEIRLAHLKEITPIDNQLDIKRAELKAAIQSSENVDQLVKEINTLQGQVFTARVNHRIQMRNVLNEEQKLKFDQQKKHHLGAVAPRRRH